MTDTDLGHALPLPVVSAELENRLARRRSAPAQALSMPGPSREQVAGFIHIGTLAEPPLERPRPDLSAKVEYRN